MGNFVLDSKDIRHPNQDRGHEDEQISGWLTSSWGKVLQKANLSVKLLTKYS